jgi:hypothetical protein
VSVVGADAVRLMPAPIMGAEDFSYVLQGVPGAMFFLGGRPASQDPATAPPNHSNRVVFEEEPMGTGGGIRNVLPRLRADNVMVFNGDVLGGTDLRGVLDTQGVKNRKQRRSKYGAKRPK